jgi:fatty acid desaturase
MDFIRWLVLDKYRDFTDSGVFIAAGFIQLLASVLVAILTLGVVGGIFGISLFVAYVVLSVAFWGVYIFVHIEQWYLKSKAEYTKKTGKE